MIDELRLRNLEAPLCYERSRKRILREPSALKEAHSARLMPSCEDLLVVEVWEKPCECRSPGGLDENTAQIKKNDLGARLHANA